MEAGAQHLRGRTTQGCIIALSDGGDGGCVLKRCGVHPLVYVVNGTVFILAGYHQGSAAHPGSGGDAARDSEGLARLAGS